MRTCDELAVCQALNPSCKGCKPSEGMRTASLILSNQPESVDEVFRYHRTLEEAFGPGHRYLSPEHDPIPEHDSRVMKAGLAAFAALALFAGAGLLPS